MQFKKFINIILLIILSCSISPSFSQQLKVENVSFESDGKIVKIKYDPNGKYNKKFKISVRLSDDNGRTFTIFPDITTGDIGKNIKQGEGKQITWYMYKDFPNGLAGNKFVFAVDAELQKGSKWYYYAIGTAGLAGGILYFLTQDEKTTTGSLVIDVPGDF